MDPTAVVSGISAAIEIARTLNSASQAMSDAERKLCIADLTAQLAEAKIDLVSLKEEFLQKDSEIAALKAAFTKREGLVAFDSFMYEPDEDGSPLGYPYCPRCMEADGKFIRATTRLREGRKLLCPECKSTYTAAVHRHR